MRKRLQAVAFLLLLSPPGARACGFGEMPTPCGQADAESDAKWMLKRVVMAVDADKAKALQEFAKGEGGFRTEDTYVFCVGPDGVMSAHPNAVLQGQDVHDLHDSTGNYFIASMMKNAKPGVVQRISYLFPRPGSTKAEQKTTFYTRAGDQMCGVGVYGAEDSAAAPEPSPGERVTQLRQRLSGEVPAGMKSDWDAFLQALDDQNGAQEATLAKVREHLSAVGAVLASSGHAAAPANP